MKLLSLIKLIAIMSVAVLFPLNSFSADILVDDFTDGDNKNSLDGIWFYYDDTRCCGNTERLQAGNGNDQSSVIDVSSYTYAQKPGGGFDYNKRVYTFEVHEEEENKYGFMPFTLGDKWQTSDGKPESFVGISTFLKPDSSGKDITGTTIVKFKLRSRLNNLKVSFIIETEDIVKDSTYTYHSKVVNVSKGRWNEFAVPISELAQPEWTPETGKKPFTPAKVIALTWEVSLLNNPTLEPYTVDTLELDDVFLSDVPNSIANRKLKGDNLYREVKVSYKNGILNLKGEYLSSILPNGTINILDVKGRIILTQKIIDILDVKMDLKKKALSNGTYFIGISTFTKANNKNILYVNQPIFIAK